jgi:hypothetical protein
MALVYMRRTFCQRMHNLFIRLLPYLPWRGLAAGGVQKAANAITLKDYRR